METSKWGDCPRGESPSQDERGAERYNHTVKTQAEKAELLRKLHHGPEILVLANVNDCAGARIVEEAGFPAIATSSAGVAFSLGYADGQRVPREEMLAAVKRICRCVEVPMTADLESGYDDAAKTTAGMIAAGAVGLNLEDVEYGPGRSERLMEIEKQVDKIAAVRRTGDQLGVKVVINARTDLYLAEIGDAATRFEKSCERLRAYIAAGADCVFVPGIVDEDLIRRFVQALKFPLNILAGPGSPTIKRLQELGVARVSLGSSITKATMGLTRRIVQEVRDKGTYESMAQGAFTWAEANRLFEK
jgi:2-methylisocitrate lyase-like PEP mutase family enzyme